MDKIEVLKCNQAQAKAGDVMRDESMDLTDQVQSIFFKMY